MLRDTWAGPLHCFTFFRSAGPRRGARPPDPRAALCPLQSRVARGMRPGRCPCLLYVAPLVRARTMCRAPRRGPGGWDAKGHPRGLVLALELSATDCTRVCRRSSREIGYPREANPGACRRGPSSPPSRALLYCPRLTLPLPDRLGIQRQRAEGGGGDVAQQIEAIPSGSSMAPPQRARPSSLRTLVRRVPHAIFLLPITFLQISRKRQRLVRLQYLLEPEGSVVPSFSRISFRLLQSFQKVAATGTSTGASSAGKPPRRPLRPDRGGVRDDDGVDSPTTTGDLEIGDVRAARQFYTTHCALLLLDRTLRSMALQLPPLHGRAAEAEGEALLNHPLLTKSSHKRCSALLCIACEALLFVNCTLETSAEFYQHFKPTCCRRFVDPVGSPIRTVPERAATTCGGLSAVNEAVRIVGAALLSLSLSPSLPTSAPAAVYRTSRRRARD